MEWVKDIDENMVLVVVFTDGIRSGMPAAAMKDINERVAVLVVGL